MLDVAPQDRRRTLRRVERFRRGKIRPGIVRSAFTRFATAASDWLGSHWAFAIAITIVVGWLVTAAIARFDESSLLVINTITTIVTFLMVFVIQNTQNRDAKAIHLKLDELLRAVPKAREEFMEAEEEDLEEILREKEIVDRADPAPPQHKSEARRSGNGRAKSEK